MKLVQQAIFDSFQIPQIHDLQEFFRIFNVLSSVNNNYLYAKFASALATLMWHFMKIAMEEVDEDVFGF